MASHKEEDGVAVAVEKVNKKIGFIGAGNMAKAVIEGIARKGLFDSKSIYVSHPSTRKYFEHLNIENETSDNEYVINNCDIIMFCVKPQILESVVASVRHLFDRDRHLIISICAGITLSKLISLLEGGGEGGAGYRIARFTMNTATMVAESCSAYSCTPTLEQEDNRIIVKILSSVGTCYGPVNDYDMNAIMSISASAIAYMCMMCDAIADGGVKMGLPKKQSQQMVAQTMLGAAKLLLQNPNKHSLQLKDEVCSPGGITIYGVHELEKSSFKASLMSAVEAAVVQAKNLNIVKKD